MARVYVTQFDTTWSMTPAAWKELVEFVVSDGAYNLDDYGKRLSRRRSKWREQKKPLDWDDEDWKNAKEELERGTA